MGAHFKWGLKSNFKSQRPFGVLLEMLQDFRTEKCDVMKYISRGVLGKKVAGSPPNSFVMVKNKTFELKHYMVFVEKNPPTGQITFLISPL